MADRVPTSGPWQTDPTLQGLIAQYIQATSGAAGSPTGQAYRGSGNARAQQLGDEIHRYVLQNRQRLGIPDNYFPDVQTRGQTLYDPNQNQFRDAAITGAAMGAGAYGLGSLGGAAPAAAPSAAGGVLPATIPGSYASSLYASGGFGVPGGTASGVAAGLGGLGAAASGGGGGGGAGAASGLLSQLTSGQGLAGLAGLLTTLATRPSGSGGSGDPFSTNPQLQHMLDVASQRVDRTDPLHQSITQLAMSRLPTNVQR